MKAKHIRMLLIVSWLVFCAVEADADPAVPPPPASDSQFTIAVLPDPQSYTQSYDITKANEKWAGKGYQYKERLDQQVRWIVDNRARYNIRLAVSLGDSVQHFGYNKAKASQEPDSYDAKVMGEWLNALHSYNLFHKDADPANPALLPYAIVCGNHDYHRGDPSILDSPEYERFFGPGRWRNEHGSVRPVFDDWYKADDAGWAYKVDGQVVATGVGRNSCQVFSGGGREFLHLALECGVTNEALAWAQMVLKQHPAKPVILATHAFLDGNGKWLPPEKMGRYLKDAPNPTNSAREIWDKLIAGNDRIFLVLCGHTWSQVHTVVQNAAGHDVHILEACYHLNYGGGRIKISQKPTTGWAYKGDTDDLDRNGSGWLRLILLDPDKGRLYTYSPVLDLWATDRKPDDYSQPDGQNGVWWNRTFPVGEDVVEEFAFDFRGRFPAATTIPATRPTKRPADH